MLAEIESGRRVRSAISDLEEALHQQKLLCFGANQEILTKLKTVIGILKEI